MPRIMVLPLSMPSHIFSMIGLGHQLRQAGHEVAILTPPQLAESVSGSGISYIPVGERHHEEMEGLRALDRPETQDAFQQKLAAITETLHDELGAAIEAHRPDLWLVDGTVAYHTFPALKRGIPTALVHTMLPLVNDGQPPSCTPYAPPENWLARIKIALAWRLLLKRNRDKLARSGMRRLFERFARQAHVPLSTLDFDSQICFDMRIPQMVTCSRALEVPRRGREDRYYVGPCVAPATRDDSDFDWEALDPARKLIYFSLGTVGHAAHAKRLVALIVEVVGKLPDLQLVLVDKWCLQPKELPDNVIVVGHAPQLALLEKAALFITHGGLNSIKESIIAGVPMLVFPQTNDQPGNGMRVQYHGIGKVGRAHRMSVNAMAELVETCLTDTAIAESVAAMRAKMKRDENANLPARFVERILGGDTDKAQTGPPTRAGHPVTV